MAEIKAAMFNLLEADHPMSVRQVFYRMVSAGVIGKTEQEYKGTVVRLLGEMRREHYLPFSWLADSTRWMKKPRSFSSLQSALNLTAETYRRALWEEQLVNVEIWLEKDALAGVLYGVTSKWDVPLMVTRGYPSLSFLYDAAESFTASGKPVVIYYFGDHDPSGLDIPRKVEHDLREFAPGVNLVFSRVAVTEEQIDAYDLPTRPTKKTDSRSGGFKGESVEVDALPPNVLREIAESCITDHIDVEALRRLERVEAEEQDVVRQIAATYAAGGVR